MRTVTSTVEAAITDADSVRMLAKIEIDPTRTYFSTLDDDYPYDGGDYSAPTDTPTGQCAIAVSDVMYTFVVDPSTGSIYGMEQGDATKNSLGISANADTKPAVRDIGSGQVDLFYWNSGLYKSTVTLSTWAVSGTTGITVDYVPADWTVTAGSPHVISGTQLGLTYLTSIGGIGCAFYSGTQWYHWTGRFMSPNTLSSLDWTIYSTAIVMGSSVFFYSTDIATGEVRGIEYIPTKNSWTDSFTALPADLSRFDVTNAILANGYVHMAGQFHRTEDLASAKVYSLVLRSIDGRNFSWDKFTLLSSLGYQFNISLGTDTLFASDRNSVGSDTASCYFVSTPSTRVTLQPPDDIISVSISSMTSATARIRGYDEEYYEHAVVKKNSRATLYIGYVTSAGTEYTLYNRYIITSKEQGFDSQSRIISLSLQDEGTWKADHIAFPFYAEILSKTTQHDDCDEVDRTYAVDAISATSISTLTVDFWNNEEWDGDGTITGEAWSFRASSGTGCERKDHTNYQGTTDQLLFKTIDLNDHPFLTEYPVLSGTTLTIHLHGWERTAESARGNSYWKVYAVTSPADDLDSKTVTTPAEGSAVFDRDYPSYQQGDEYPLEFTYSGLTAGHVLQYIGVAIDNSVAGTSTSCPERLEIDGVTFTYSQTSDASAWKLGIPTGETRSYLRVPSSGLPSMLFTVKPYTAFKFCVAGEYIYEAGSEPLSVGNTYWGVIGLAKDGTSYFVARYRKQTSNIELVQLRDKTETIIAYYTPGAQPNDIMLDHRDGTFRVWYRTADTWTGPVITHRYDEITYGVLSESETGIMHTGVLAAINPPGFISPGFNPAYADGVCMLTGQSTSLLDDFPASGSILVNDTQYQYTGKTTGSTSESWGPYQGRQTSDIGSYTDYSDTFSGTGVEIALYKPSKSSTAVSNLLLASDNGYTWLIDKTDWTVVHYNAGVPNPLRNRSKHFCDNATGNYIGTSNRVFLNSGLLGLTQKGDGGGIHPYGSWVTLYSTDKIFAEKIVSTQVDHDATVKDMLKLLCATASVDTVFPGDWTSASESISATPTLLANGVEQFPGGFDLTFTIPDAGWTDVHVYANNMYVTDSALLDIGFTKESSQYTCYVDPQSGSFPAEYIQTGVPTGNTRDMRILFHDEFVSMYIDKVLVATFALGTDNLTWPDTQLYIYMASDSAVTVTDLTLTELFDWREAIYIESEMSAQSAIGSVIQERPVEVYPDGNGKLRFSYNLETDTVTYTSAESARILRRHRDIDKTVGDAGSDAVVYYTDIAFVSNSDYADEEGFNTRVLKLGSLDTGAKNAAEILLRKAYQKQKMHSFAMRPDIRLWAGDIIDVTYTLPGTSTVVNPVGIIESLSIEIREGEYSMTVEARHV